MAIEALFAEKAPYGLSDQWVTLADDAAFDAFLLSYITDTSKPFGTRYYPVVTLTDSNTPGISGCRWAVEIYKHSATYGWITAKTYSYENGVRTICRAVVSGNLTPWEWDNPPMVLGVEYRTTKRYLNKPVYTRAVDFGALTNATNKNVAYPDAAATMVSLRGVLSNGNAFTSGYNWDRTNAGKFWVDNTKWNIRILPEGDASSVSAVVVVEYVY